MKRCQRKSINFRFERCRRSQMPRRQHSLESLETRHLLAAAPVAVNDSFSVNEDAILFADDPGSSWSETLQQASPLHWWDFEETSGGILRDRGAAHVDAALGGGVVLDQTGAVGRAAYFDSTGFARIAEPQLTSDWTVETIARLNVNEALAHSVIGASQAELSGGNGVTLRLGQYPSTGEIGITHYGNSDWRMGAPAPTVFAHVAWVGSSSGVDLYVAGKHAAHLDQVLPLSRYVIGCGYLVESGPNAYDAMVGWIDELAVYNRVLSAQEIATHALAMDATVAGAPGEPNGVLTNDTDADGDSLTAQLVTSTTHGVLVFNPNGGFRYTPELNYYGTDQFTYRVSDGSLTSNVATVTLQVASVNDRPTAVNDQDYEVPRDQPITVTADRGVLVNDSDPEGDPLSVSLVSPPALGTVELHADGSFVYTPRAGTIGRDEFSYHVSDGQDVSDVAHVTLRIVRSEATGIQAVDDNYTVAEDGTLVIDTSPWLSTLSIPLTVQSIAYDPAGDRLFATIPPGSGPLAGTLTEIDPYTGKLGQSIPLPSYLGEIVISDDGSTLFVVVDDWLGVQIIDLNTMTLTKKIVTAPYGVGAMLAVPGTSDSIAMVTWDGSIHQPVGTYIYKDGERLPSRGLGNAIAFDETGEHMFGYENWVTSFTFWTHDVDEQGLHVTREYPWGSMLSGFVGYQYAKGHLFVGGNSGAIVDIATKRNVGNFDGGLISQVVSAENTLYSFDDRAQQFYTYDLTTLLKRDTLRVPGIGPVRQVLTRFGQDGLVVYNENTVTMVRSDKLFGITRRGVLRNDRIIGTADPTVSLVQGVEHGSLELNADGTFRYQPAPNYFGTDHFVYSFEDGDGLVHSASVNLTVTSVNDLPQAQDDQYVLPPTGALSVDAANGVLANDSDPADGDNLAAVLMQGPKYGTLKLRGDGSFTYTPKTTFVLSDQFTYQASDGQGRSQTQTVVIRLDVPTIEVGSHTLQANTPNQRIDLWVTGGQLVAGFDLYAQVGDGGPERTELGLPAGVDGPEITHVELKENTIFAGVPDAATNLGSLPQVANWSISVTGGGGVDADGRLATLVVDTTGFFEGVWDLRLKTVLPDYNLGPLDSRFASMLAFITNGSIEVVPAEVLERHVFYNHSSWDGDDLEANAGDDHAVAAEKQALLPGETATFANYTNYSRGINGVMIDVRGLPSDRPLTLDDFELRTGRQSVVGSWSAAPTPTLTVRPGAGDDGADRVTLTWPDHAIENAWLEIRMKSGPGTLLGHDDVFYFGNAIGETGTTPSNSFVTSIDVIGARDHQRGPFELANIDDVYDFNRDRLVSSIDVILARDHQTGALNSLPLITAPASRLAALAIASTETHQPAFIQHSPVLGDVNDDGVFDSADLVAVFQRGKYESVQDERNALWTDGDWDGDGDFDYEDLIAAFQAASVNKTRALPEKDPLRNNALIF